MSDQGFLYYAMGDKWIAEAQVSAASLRAAMPEAKVAIVSDRSLPEQLFQLQIRPPAGMQVKQLKMWTMQHSPFERTLFLDSDTWVADSLWEVFSLLDRFQLAAALAPIWALALRRSGGETETDGISVAFPKLNTGVVCFRREPAVDALFADWARRHAEAGYGQDQDSFRQALFASELRFAPLPPGYNYRLPFPYGIKGQIKVFHGRVRSIAAVAGQLNASTAWRVNLPWNRRLRRHRYVVERRGVPLWKQAVRRLLRPGSSV